MTQFVKLTQFVDFQSKKRPNKNLKFFGKETAMGSHMVNFWGLFDALEKSRNG